MRERHVSCRVSIVEGTRRCAKCKTSVAVEDFHKSARTFSGLQTRCKACGLAYAWCKQFRISWEDAQKLLAKKTEGCFACSTSDDLHLDHDHQTGRIRGFLCGNCNRALGILRDDPVRILRLREYLASPSPLQ